MHLRSASALNELRRLIFESNKKIVFITGAGISVSSGIPLYRSDILSESTVIPNDVDGDDVVSDIRDKRTNSHIIESDIAYEATKKKGYSLGCNADGVSMHQERLPLQKQLKETMRNVPIDDCLIISTNSVKKNQTAIWNCFIESQALRSTFLNNPHDWYHTFWNMSHNTNIFREALPSIGHVVLAKLCTQFNKRLSIVTQNVDCLHKKAETPANSLTEIHGRLGDYRCSNVLCQAGKTKVVNDMHCKWKYSSAEFAQDLFPYCPLCDCILMPLTLLFDESYESHKGFQWEKAAHQLEKADIFVFVGTSLNATITFRALECARKKNAFVFNINIKRVPLIYQRFDSDRFTRYLHRFSKCLHSKLSPKTFKCNPQYFRKATTAKQQSHNSIIKECTVSSTINQNDNIFLHEPSLPPNKMMFLCQDLSNIYNQQDKTNFTLETCPDEYIKQLNSKSRECSNKQDNVTHDNVVNTNSVNNQETEIVNAIVNASTTLPSPETLFIKTTTEPFLASLQQDNKSGKKQFCQKHNNVINRRTRVSSRAAALKPKKELNGTLSKKKQFLNSNIQLFNTTVLDEDIFSKFFVIEEYPAHLARHLIGTTEDLLPLLLKSPTNIISG